MKSKENIDYIYKSVIEHIKNIGDAEVSKEDKEIDKLLIEEDVLFLIKELRKCTSIDSTEYIRVLLKDIQKKLGQYLLEVYKYDEMMLRVYAILEKCIGNLD